MGAIVSSNVVLDEEKDISSSTLQIWRERPPSSYSIKVQIFSKLRSSAFYSDGKYQSRRFSSGGYNCVYSDEESKPFNTLRTVWGFPRVLPLDTFNNHKNGYLFDGDHCEFGVDVFVAPPPTKWEIISFGEKLPYPKFSWTLKKFSQINENPRSSETFSKGGKKWVLKLYPKGHSTPDCKWLSIFLSLAGDETLKEDEKIYVEADIRVEDPRGSNHVTGHFNSWHEKAGSGFGFDHFMSSADLRKSYLDNEDTLKVEIEFKAVSATKYSS